MAERLDALEEKFNLFSSSVDASIQRLTEAIAGLNKDKPNQVNVDAPNQAQAVRSDVEAPDRAPVETPASRPDVPTSGSQSTATVASPPDVQGEFAAVRDSYQKVKLPPDLRLNESRTGICREDQPAFNVVTRSARFVETVFKILSLIDKRDDCGVAQDVENLFTVSLAHMRYLQDEYSSLVVQGSFDQTTSRLFRQLQRQTSGLTGEAVENLHRAAGLAAVANRASPNSSAPRGRGGSRGYGRGRGRGRFPFNERSGGASSDFFNRYSHRQPFPQQPPVERD